MPKPEPAPTLMPLSSLMLMPEHADQEPERDQECMVDGRFENLRAVLAHTAVVGPADLRYGDERSVVKLNQVLVDPKVLRWQSKVDMAKGQYWTAKGRKRGQAAARANAQKAKAQKEEKPT
jgi:hypothetical protein